MDTTLVLAHAYSPADAGYHVRALLTVRGAAPDGPARAPLAVSLVLDRSGSMAGAPLDAARDAAVRLLRRLRPADVASVVAYDDVVETVAPAAAGEGRAAAVAATRRLDARGSTNLSGGWLRGRELALEPALPDGAVRRVVLLTDGLANAGITDPALLMGLCRTARGEGVTTTTIGFGPAYDEGLLRGMADAGGGSTYYVERADQAEAVFAEEVEGLLALAAQNVAVEVRPGAAARLVAVHHDYPAHPVDGGMRVELGDLYAHEPRTLLLEFLVAGAPEAVPGAVVATLAVHGHVLTPAGGVERRVVTLPVGASLSPEGMEAPAVTRELLLLSAARAREAALRARTRGDYAEGAAALRAVADDLATAAVDGATAPLMAEEIADLSAMAERFAAREVSAADAKYLGQMAYSTHRGKVRGKQMLRRE